MVDGKDSDVSVLIRHKESFLIPNEEENVNSRVKENMRLLEKSRVSLEESEGISESSDN